MKPINNNIILLIKVFLILIVLDWLGWYLYTMKDVVPFHEDEHIYINRAIFFDLYQQGDFTNSLWHSFESDYPKLPDIIYGAILTQYKQMSVKDYLKLVGFNTNVTDRSSWNVRYSQASLPISELPTNIYSRIEPIRVARWASLVFSVSTLICVILIWWLLGDWFAGIVAVISLGLHPLFSHVTLTAMGDSALIFFSLLSLLISLLWFRGLLKKKQIYRWTVLLGVSLGLAISAKLNGLFSALYVAILSLLLTFHKRVANRLSIIWPSFLLIAVTSFTTVFLMSPQIWPNPLTGFMGMLQARNEIIEKQQQLFSEDALRTFTDRVATIPDWVFSRHAEYGNFQPEWINVILFLVGLGAIVHRLLKQQSKKDPHNQLLQFKAFLLWLLIIGGITTMLIPLNWNRYYLPIVIVVIMIQSFGISSAVKFAFIFVRRASH